MKIQVKNLSFGYKSRPVLNLSDVQFEEGKAYGIVGKNGAGKTTFFKCLVNIITNYHGYVLIDQVEVRSNPSILSKVGIVLDDMSLYKSRSGMFNLRYFVGLRGELDATKIFKLADELGIATVLDQKVSTYSLGMTKKLQLLISLISDAEILIFDEPFRGLDSGTVDWFRDYLINLKNHGKTILISSHVQEDIEAISDNVFVLENGNFIKEFDLKDRNQEFIYTVGVNDKERVKLLLKDFNRSFTEVGDLIRFNAFEEEYRRFFKQAIDQGIEFEQIKKEVQFTQFVR